MGVVFYEDDSPEFRQEYEWAQGFHIADTVSEFGNSQLDNKGMNALTRFNCFTNFILVTDEV